MRGVNEFLVRAAEFEALAARTADANLKRRYRDLAVGYRTLAEHRQRLIDEGLIEPEK